MSQKRQHLIDTALALFYRHGIHAIGINEVIASSGVAKRTLYTHFDSKEALVLATLAQRHEAFIDWLRQCLSGSTNDTETVERVFDALHRWFTGGAAPRAISWLLLYPHGGRVWRSQQCHCPVLPISQTGGPSVDWRVTQ